MNIKQKSIPYSLFTPSSLFLSLLFLFAAVAAAPAGALAGEPITMNNDYSVDIDITPRHVMPYAGDCSGGGYAGVKGFTHGLWKGPQWQDGEVWNVEDPAVANEVHGLDDTVMEVRWGNKVGYGIMENMVIPPFKRYLPTMPARK